MQEPILEHPSKIEVSCPTCGKLHLTWRNRPNKYCCGDCWYNRNSKDPNYKRRVDCICKVCGVGFTIRFARTKVNGGKYCSYRCHQVGEGQKGGGETARKTYRTGTRHPYVKRGGRHEHRVVMENLLGRPLTSDDVVHHLDNNGKNNDPSNLLLTTRFEHPKFHLEEMRIGRLKAKHERNCT